MPVFRDDTYAPYASPTFHVPRPRTPHPVFPGMPGYHTAITIPGSKPDYNALIHADPTYASWLGSANQRKADAATARAQAIKAALLRHGGVLPPGFKDQFGDVTQADLALAMGNQNSDEAVLQRNYDQGVEAMRRALAARGGLQSGELGYGQNQADIQHSQDEYTLGQSFLDQINAALGGYTTGVNNVNAEEAGVLASVAPNIYNTYKPTADTSASLDTGSTAKYGFPVYKDSSGNYYKVDANGNPVKFDPGTVAPASPAVPTGGIGVVRRPVPGIHPHVGASILHRILGGHRHVGVEA